MNISTVHEFCIVWRIRPFYRNWPSWWAVPANLWLRPLQFVFKLLYWLWPIAWYVQESGPGMNGEIGMFISANDAAVFLCDRASKKERR